MAYRCKCRLTYQIWKKMQDHQPQSSRHERGPEEERCHPPPTCTLLRSPEKPFHVQFQMPDETTLALARE
ncbi:hypothetical protein DPMN_180603 [Dreissena polymorpha]|uniref:Uncharacterized protein n=1 Tax=Dreissena polymorpha TaxID=45954 RepID=A0A9D4EEH2_DREPO|nr:hypothetical protein DPMN_044642 [Dreissena polymorpha]KAH3779124.1 hypothetical protein DPMN_180603 [Dreissena polymorpha]